jgi:hypothetical protein
MAAYHLQFDLKNVATHLPVYLLINTYRRQPEQNLHSVLHKKELISLNVFPAELYRPTGQAAGRASFIRT